MTTADKIAALEDAIATGHLSVRLKDGTAITYRSMAEMERALAMLRAKAGNRPRQWSTASVSKH